MPRVSVIMPAYNAGDFIADAVESVLEQSMREFELLIVNDGSRDSTLAQISTFADRDGRVRVLSHETPQGPSAARNTALREARGEWVAFLDSDDVWTSDSLTVRLAVAAEHPNCDFLATDWCRWRYADRDFSQAFHAGSGCLRKAELDVHSFRKAFDTEHSISINRPVREFLVRCPVHTITVMARRELLSSIGGFDTDLARGEDLHCWLRLAARSDFCFSAKVTAVYRIREGSASHQQMVSASEGAPKACKALLPLEEMQPYKKQIKAKMGWYYLQNSYFYRKLGFRRKAFVQALLAVVTDWRHFNVLHNFAAASLCR